MRAWTISNENGNSFASSCAFRRRAKPPPRISSGRTLFGIKSEVEEKMDAIAREMEEKQRAKRVTRKDSEQSE